MNNKSEYIQKISQFIDLENRSIFFYWKGRVGLFAILKAIGIGKDDEVVMPGLTCVVVPNAVIYLGAKPVYVDVNIDTCNASFDSIKSAVTDKTKVILVQNTFGLSTDVDRIAQWAKSKGIYTIEDCTHGFGGTYKEEPNGSYCDAAIYSTQWNKPFSTGIGGFAIVNNPLLVNGVTHANKNLVLPTFLESFQLKLLVIFHRYLITNTTYWFFIALYRRLSKMGLVIGSSSRNEIEGIEVKHDYFKAASEAQLTAGISGLKHFSERISLRKKNAWLYTELLSGLGKYHVNTSLFDNHSFLKYPILVRNRKDFMLKAENAHIMMGDWFTSVLHPVPPPFTLWHLDIEKLPNALFLSQHLVNLPTDLSNIEEVLIFLNSNIEDILSDETDN